MQSLREFCEFTNRNFVKRNNEALVICHRRKLQRKVLTFGPSSERMEELLSMQEHDPQEF